MATETHMNEFYPILHHCSFFDGIPQEKYPNVLACLNAVRRDYCRDSSVLEIGDQMPLSGIVLKGTLEVSLLDEIGSQINVNHIEPGQGFGMAMACAQCTCPIRLRAVTDCTLLFLNFANVMDPEEIGCPWRARVAANLLRDLARQTVFLNRRLRIMGQKRLRDKIKVYLQYQKMEPDGTIQIPFKRNAWADFLYADRSALSRELGRMAEEGILTVDRQTVRILDPEFLKY